MGAVMDDGLKEAIEATSARLEALAARLEDLGASLTDASFAMLDYAQPSSAAAPRSPEVLGENVKRHEP
jgi:hypothetical protein